MQRQHLIYGVHITQRVRHVPEVQRILTTYGANIKTRLGLHEASDIESSPNGLLILEMVGEPEKARRMADELRKVEGIEVQEMVFGHP